MNEIIIRQSQSKQLWLVLLGILMVAGSIFIFTQGFIVIGLIGIIFFGLCLIFIVIRFINPKNILIISDNGFTDCSSLSSVGFVSWEGVEDISITSIFNNRFISVKINEEKVIINSKAKKIIATANKAIGFAEINITLQSANAKYEYVLSKMQTYWLAYHSK